MKKLPNSTLLFEFWYNYLANSFKWGCSTLFFTLFYIWFNSNFCLCDIFSSRNPLYKLTYIPKKYCYLSGIWTAAFTIFFHKIYYWHIAWYTIKLLRDLVTNILFINMSIKFLFLVSK